MPKRPVIAKCIEPLAARGTHLRFRAGVSVLGLRFWLWLLMTKVPIVLIGILIQKFTEK